MYRRTMRCLWAAAFLFTLAGFAALGVRAQLSTDRFVELVVLEPRP